MQENLNFKNGVVKTNLKSTVNKKDLHCIQCGKTEYSYNTNIGKSFCSWGCYEEYKKFNNKPNIKCVICGREFYVKPSRIKRVKHGITCSEECKAKLKSKLMSGEGNHQYGIKGDKNASFTGAKRTNQYGYIMLYLPNHPKADRDGRYREHRYIIEKIKEIDESFFEHINGYRVLKDTYLVHHHNEKKTDNRPENLMVVTRSVHTTIHNNNNRYLKNINNGSYNYIINTNDKIIGVIKFRELLETPDEDNQQPSLTSNSFEGSTTSSQVQTSNVEDSNTTKSAEQSKD